MQQAEPAHRGQSREHEVVLVLQCVGGRGAGRQFGQRYVFFGERMAGEYDVCEALARRQLAVRLRHPL